MKGFNFSLGFTMTDFRGRKNKDSKDVDGPSPVPDNPQNDEDSPEEGSLPNEDQERNSANKE